MKKILLIFALILTLSAACFAFTACGDDTQSDPGDNSAEPNKNEIFFKTLEVNGTDVYGRVSKDKEIFEFTNEIKVSGNAKYVVALDALGMQTVATKTVSLNEGDNTFYVIEMVDDEATEVYTVIIHRNEVYEVSFDTAGLVALTTQYIEEGFFATAPTENVTTRLGYEFLGWDFDFTKPITGDVVVKAKIEQKEEMKIFDFISTTTTCHITSLIDKTVTEIAIPDYVTSIGDSAFYNCYNLKYVTIGNGVTSIGNGAFQQCRSLKSITIPDSVTSIGSQAFCNCTSLKSVTIPDNVTSIGSSAFSDCYSLASVTIGNGITSIGDCAFSACTSLTSVTIGNSVTSIGSQAFYNCTSLKSVTIPDSVTSIGSRAFYNCISLTSVTIPDNVTSIGSYTFYKCTSLTSVTIPNSVTSIGSYAFYWCTSLTSIVISDSVTSIGDRAFYNCTSLTSIKYRGTQTQWAAISKGSYWNSDTPYTITYNYTEE